MSGVYYAYPQAGPQVAVPRMVAAALLAIAAAMTVGGSFGAFSIYRFESDVLPATTTTTTGWGDFEEPVSEGTPSGPDILHGIPLVVAAVLALVAAAVLVLTARRPGDQAAGRLLGASAAGLMVGVVAVIWLELVTFIRNVAANAEPDSAFQSSFQVGAGGYLILVGGLAALAAVVLLMVPRRGPAPAPPFGPGPPQWPGAQWPGAQWPGAQWPGQSQSWPPPGPAAPPSPWAPPPGQ